MGRVTCDISMSLDGFITGPNMAVGNGMGDDAASDYSRISAPDGSG